MSGAQIGGFIGGVIGSYFGPVGGYIGSAIGSYIGGVIDPTIYKGPSIGDAQQQASTTGMPIPKIYGHSPPIAPTLIDGDKIARKVKHTQDVGKGSTQKTETEGWVATRFFVVCENPDGDARIARITRNGKLVYSAIAGDELDADSATFMQQFTEYTGGPTQGPDPSLEAIHGVGNTPYYRKRLCFIVRDDDETQTQGMANQYRIEVISNGAFSDCSDQGPLFYWPLAGDGRELIQGKDGVISGTSGGGALRAGSDGSLSFDDLSDYFLADYPDIFRITATDDWTVSAWVVVTDNDSGGSVMKNVATLFADPQSGTYNFSLQLRDAGSGNMTPAASWSTDGTNSSFLTASTPLGVGEAALITFTYTYDGTGGQGTFALYVNGRLADSSHETGPDWSGRYMTSGGYAYPSSYGFIGATSDITIWNRAFTADEVADSYINSDDYLPLPDLPGAYVGRSGQVVGACRPTVTPDAVLWKDVATDIAGRASTLLPDRLHVESMTDEVPGYVLGNATLTASDYLRTLCAFYFTDLVEKDGGIHAVRRGGAIQTSITDDDLLLVEDEDDTTRQQESIDGWQRVTVIYPDPSNNYVPTSQTAPRSSPDILAGSEVNIECPFPFDHDTAKQKADILQKIRYMQIEGGFKRALPAEFSKYIPSDPVMFNDRRHIITKTSNDDSMVRWEATYDRASAYVSAAKGSRAPAPTPQTSNLKGPTIFKAMNSPSLSSDMNTPGLLIAARGLLPGWSGANLKISLDGGETYFSALTLQRQAVMGRILASVGANSDSLQVELWGNDLLESASTAQLAANANFFTVVTNDVMDIGQFANASEDSNGDFDLSSIAWGQVGTTAAAHTRGDTFVLLEQSTLSFLPIDISFAGQTIWLWPITFGTAEDQNPKYSLVFNPLISGPQTYAFYTNASGEKYADANGSYYYEVV
jgi:hypothetical protein